MTADQAYIEGFCKAAEVAGVEPVALMKAALDPATAGGAAAMALGGALGGSSLTGDDQSFAKRVGKGAIGTALGYAGYKAMTDPRWQAGIRNGTQKAMDIIRSAIGRLPAKAASARPTVKQAARIPFMGAIANGLRAVAGSRAGQAVAGAARRVADSRAGQAVAGAARRVADSRAGQAVGGAARRYGELMMGGSNPVRGAFRLGKADLSSMDKLRGWLKTYWQGLSGKMGPEAAAELRKALAARAGTAAVGAAGLRALSGGDDNNVPPSPYYYA